MVLALARSCLLVYMICFFFSSRRRHTRYWRDWSSDVCSSDLMPELDFSTMESLEQLDSVIRRDFETKAPSGTEILERVRTGAYATRYDLMPDMALNLFWANRFSITMYDKRPTRWAAVPRSRSDVLDRKSTRLHSSH